MSRKFTRRTMQLVIALYFLLQAIVLAEAARRSGQMLDFVANMAFFAVGLLLGRYVFAVKR